MPFDLFEHSPVGRIWIESCESLEKARIRMHKLSSIRKVSVLLYDVSRGTFIEEIRCS